MDATIRALQTQLDSLRRELETAHKTERYYRSIAYYLAGYFRAAADQQGIDLGEDFDLVDWAAKQNGAKIT